MMVKSIFVQTFFIRKRLREQCLSTWSVSLGIIVENRGIIYFIRVIESVLLKLFDMSFFYPRQSVTIFKKA